VEKARVYPQGNISNKGEFILESTNVMVTFNMYGDYLDPQVITDKLGIQPHEYWIKGEDIPGKSISRKKSCWRVSTGYQESLDINDQIDRIMEIFQGKSDKLNELMSALDLEILLSVVINIENNQKPAMYFNRQTIAFINQIKAEIDIDLYIYS
jgi:hypothetical protein